MRISALVSIGIASTLAGCLQAAEPPQPMELRGDFVEVPRDNAAAPTKSTLQQALTSEDTRSFYIAIRKSELNKKYFLTAYLKQLEPLFRPAAESLGTRVVTLREQNAKLMVFDAKNDQRDGQTFNPDIIVESFPIITNSVRFNSAPNAQDYVLFDPAAGLNRFGLLPQELSERTSDGGGNFTNDLQFSDRFRFLADGVQYDQIFTGHFDRVPDDLTGLDALLGAAGHQRIINGTLSISWRKYIESDHVPTNPVGADGELAYYYFPSSAPFDTAHSSPIWQRWPIYPGMEPIEWVVSSHIDNLLLSHPEYANYDIKGAIKAGIENWNQAFGFEVVKARFGTSATENGDDNRNVLVVDEVANFGFAFADTRENPNTGEIRGASVYMNSGWIDLAINLYGTDAQSAQNLPSLAKNMKAAADAQRVVASWNGMHHSQDLRSVANGLRARTVEELAAQLKAKRRALVASTTALTAKQKVERYITHVVLHEIGHTLGLRHNFKGSLAKSSVMDYVTDDEAIQMTSPGSFDRAAIALLYGLTSSFPTDAYCTDDDIRIEPDCQPFDKGANPLHDFYIPGYQTAIAELSQTGAFWLRPDTLGIYDYVKRSNSLEDQLLAWHTIMDPIKPSLPVTTDPAYALTYDAIANMAWEEFYGEPTFASLFLYKTGTPDASDELAALQLPQLSDELRNADGFRSLNSRRTAIRVLKKLQTPAAYQVLVDGLPLLTAQRQTAVGLAALELDDLIQRAQNATTHYLD